MTKGISRTAWVEARESGQALVMVLICIALMAVLVPVIVTQAVSTASTTSQAVLFEDALAAAQAGVQQYRNLLDLEQNYYQCNWQNDCGNVALDIDSPGCPDAASPTCGWFVMNVPSGAPAEAFHYIPDPCFNTGSCQTGAQAVGTAAILLTATGRAGNPGGYVYRTIQVTLESTGLLSNAYFSNYEVLDAAQNTNTVNVETYSEINGKTRSNSTSVTGTFPGVVVGDTVNEYSQTGVIPEGSGCSPAQPSNCTTVTAVSPAPPATPTTLTLSQAANNSVNSTPLDFGTIAKATMQTAPTVPSCQPSNCGAGGPTSEPFWQALCLYHTYEANTFVDSLYGTSNAQTSTQQGTQPQSYFGPWRGNSPSGQAFESDTFDYAYSSTLADGTPSQALGVAGGCGGPYNFGSSETFNGPVYTEDQLFVCGNPNFEFGLNSSISASNMGAGYSNWLTYKDSNNGGPWIDNIKTDWDGSCTSNAGNSSPSFGSGGDNGGGTETLPPVNGALATAAQSGGCYYTGPTIIEFVKGGYMDVWSPLSGLPSESYSVGSTATCGTWPATSSNDGFQQVALPPGGLVIYVANTPSSVPASAISTAVTYGEAIGALPSNAQCPDPWIPYFSPSACPQYPFGDAIVEGELKGQVTIGTANSIVISRDLSYQCADDTSIVESQASNSYTGFPTTGANNCRNGEPDILGLAAEGDVVVSHPGATSAGSDNQVPRQTEPGEWPSNGWCPLSQDGTEVTQSMTGAAAIPLGVPNCDVSNPVVDAAVMAVTGSFADEDWDMTDNNSAPTSSQGVWLQGADISKYRGPFSCSNLSSPTVNWCFNPNTGTGFSTGYQKEFSYDSRLSFLTPPDLLKLAALLWNTSGLVNCGSVNDNPPAASLSLSQNLCPGLVRLGG